MIVTLIPDTLLFTSHFPTTKHSLVSRVIKPLHPRSPLSTSCFAYKVLLTSSRHNCTTYLPREVGGIVLRVGLEVLHVEWSPILPHQVILHIHHAAVHLVCYYNI